ncbi:hypothetical protein L1987_81021 [Smallanthus sonchifolius]|uniref:Uncharacterized protein n=1 Tax=Smallanthus sonchifolius TaxID=185202 RepID=A0ACB8YQE6_9ASTR|nr:hypothetical protein L1987_81021 [Smallanthus sonchifolius]
MDRVNIMVFERPVVIFSKNSCMLSYTIKSLFNNFGVNPTIYELDEIVRGGEIEHALSVLGHSTVPVVFIGGELVGGANEIMSLLLKRDLKPMLIRAGALWAFFSSLNLLHLFQSFRSHLLPLALAFLLSSPYSIISSCQGHRYVGIVLNCNMLLKVTRQPFLGRGVTVWKNNMTTFDLPQEVLQLLPSDPFEQLDFARKITSIALFTRISALESESSDLLQQLTDKDLIADDLHAQIDSLNISLSDVVDKLSRADQEKEVLLKENASLAEQVKKLNRDVAKLESFRKTLMMSLQDEEGSSDRKPMVAAPNVPNHTSLSSQSIAGENDETVPLSPPSESPITSQSSDVQDSNQDEPVTNASRTHVSPPGLLLASKTSTPRLIPPATPPSLSASGSPKRTSMPVSPRRHSISFSSTRSMSDDRSSAFSSATSTPYGSMSGRTRVDGKEFFRQVRGRLSYEQFSAFLANVKELNSHKQTKEDTLRVAGDIFGPENKDLYAIFEGLITRNVH